LQVSDRFGVQSAGIRTRGRCMVVHESACVAELSFILKGDEMENLEEYGFHIVDSRGKIKISASETEAYKEWLRWLFEDEPLEDREVREESCEECVYRSRSSCGMMSVNCVNRRENWFRSPAKVKSSLRAKAKKLAERR